eukprot:Em0034g38a
MRHSCREQSRSYDRRTSSDKVSRAVALASDRVAVVLDTNTASRSSSKSSRKVKSRPDSQELHAIPEIGDIIAAVQDVSTLREPLIWFGKVMRVYAEKKEVLLGELVQQNGRAKNYKLKIGQGTWVEPFDSLVYPVDMAYNSSSGMYTLRTSLREIHMDVKGNAEEEDEEEEEEEEEKEEDEEEH